jgi:hypothetical protein
VLEPLLDEIGNLFVVRLGRRFDQQVVQIRSILFVSVLFPARW